MSSSAEKYNQRGIRTSYVSTVIGISLVLFMIGMVLGGILALDSVQTQAKENLQGDLFFKAEMNEADIKQIEQELKTWPEFNEVYFVSPERAMEEFSGLNNDTKEIEAIFEGENFIGRFAECVNQNAFIKTLSIFGNPADFSSVGCSLLYSRKLLSQGCKIGSASKCTN